MHKFIVLLSILLGNLYCLSVHAEQRAFGIELCSEIIEFEGEAYFCGTHHRLGRELFRTNGTAQGTFVVADIDLGTGSSDPSHFFVLNGKLYFFAENSGTGREIWLTDGTAQGTKRITDFEPGPDGFPLRISVFNAGNVVYIQNDNFQDAIGVWRTDGTSDGTKFILGGTDVSIVGVFNNALYFKRNTFGSEQIEVSLERVPETSTESQLVKDFGADCLLFSTFPPGRISDGRVSNQRLYFRLDCDQGSLHPGPSTFITDGTEQGTRLYRQGTVIFLAELDNRLYFYNVNEDTVESTDGLTTEALGLCGESVSCIGASSVRDVEVNGKFLFGMFVKRVQDTQFSYRIYSSDGTLHGTTIIADGRTFSHQAIGSRALLNTRLDNGGSRQLLTSDGSPGGTRALRSSADTLFSSGRIYAAANQFIFFEKRIPEATLNLWRSNGLDSERIFRFPSNFGGPTHASTEGNRLYFGIANFLWHTDGTAQGTYRMTYLDTFVPPPMLGSNGTRIVPLINLLLEEDEDKE